MTFSDHRGCADRGARITASIHCSCRVSRKPNTRERRYRFQLMMGSGAHGSTITSYDEDSDIHNAISQMRSLDGTVPPVAKHGPPLPGPPVNFFAPYGQPKFWVKKGAHPFGYFFFYVLDKAICPFLAETLGIPFLRPTTQEQVDRLLAVTVDV